MSIPGQAFTVLTEFKFDIGHAIADSEALSGAVGKIATAAEGAQFAIARMSLSFAGSLFGGGGMLAAFTEASKAADGFANSQISIANSLNVTGDSFTNRMLLAEEVMERLNKQSMEFSLNFKDLVATTKMMAPMLLNMGLAGPGLINATELSRKFLKASPTLGVDPGLAQGELIRTISGHASMNDTLFQRLTSETVAMKEFTGQTAKWNALKPDERMKKLSQALGQFSKDTDALHARIHTLSGQLAQLKNNITNLLRPMGEAINKVLIAVLERLNGSEIMAKARSVSKSMTKIFGDLITTPERLYADLRTAQQAPKALKTAGKVVGSFAIVEAIAWVMGKLGVEIAFLTPLINFLAGSIHAMFGSTMALGLVLKGGFLGALDAVLIFFSEMLVPLLAIAAVLLFFGRALSFAYEAGLKRITAELPRFAMILSWLSGIFSVLLDGIDVFARALGGLLDPTLLFGFFNMVQLLGDVLEWVVTKIGQAMMAFQGIVFFFMEMVNQIRSFITGNGFDGGKTLDAANYGMEMMYEKIFGKIDKGEGAVAQQVVNQNIHMQNNFKEMLEPDRVAFTIRDELLRAARNKTQANGRGMEAAGAKNR